LFRFLPNGLPEDRPIDKDIGFNNSRVTHEVQLPIP
jgi:hypothetical protein